MTHWFRFFTAKLLIELVSAILIFGTLKLLLLPIMAVTLTSVMNFYLVFTILNLVFAWRYAGEGNRLGEIGAGTQAAVSYLIALAAWIGS